MVSSKEIKGALEISMNPCKDSAGELLQQETLFLQQISYKDIL